MIPPEGFVEEAPQPVKYKVHGHGKSGKRMPMFAERQEYQTDGDEREELIELGGMNGQRPLIVDGHFAESIQVIQEGRTAGGLLGHVERHAREPDPPG